MDKAIGKNEKLEALLKAKALSDSGNNKELYKQALLTKEKLDEIEFSHDQEVDKLKETIRQMMDREY